MIIKFIQVNKLSYNQESWQQLAKKVYKQLQIDKSIDIGNKLLITIPYVKVSNPGLDQYFYMPGFYYGNNVLFNNSLHTNYKNISTKKTFTVDDADEPLFKFLREVDGNVLQIKDIMKKSDRFKLPEFNHMAHKIHQELLELHNQSNLRKPKIKIWINETELIKDINPNILKEYIQYAFDNCFEADNTVDFKLGYDLEFIDENGVKRDDDNIVVCVCELPTLKRLCPDSDCIYDVGGQNDAAQIGEGNKGQTPSSLSCPILIIANQFHNYYAVVYGIFHEVTHRITKFGSDGDIDSPLSFAKIAEMGKGKDQKIPDHDFSGLMMEKGYGTEANRILSKSDMKTQGLFNIPNLQRRYVMYRLLLRNIQKFNYINK